jgi:pyruvate/2-oxoglutarate dehydrogenase complex dihydrolipoamide dehydrogenase (E3) component
MRLLVLGGGPAGATAAMHARELGAEVTLVEANRAGGTSLNDGPAPVRTLARAARLMRDARSWDRFGLHGAPPRIDIADALANSRRVADYALEQRQLGEFMRANGIDLVEGTGPAVFQDLHTVRVADGRTFTGDAIIVAVGGHAGRLPIPGAELGKTYSDIRDLTELPGSAAVVGGADTGVQIASILADFGSSVTVFEFGPRLASRADQEISEALAEAFTRRGIDVRVGTGVERLERTGSGVTAHYRAGDQQSQLAVDAVFFAVGWPGNADTLGAESVGITTRRGCVQVGPDLRSNVPHILAAGDVNGISMLVPSARYEGRIAAENAVLGTHRPSSHDLVPTGSFTDPEFGGVGLTEAQAREKYDCEVAVAYYTDMVRPVADGHPEGFCKLIVERRHRIVLGAHVIGEYSAEVIQMVSACMAGNMRIEQIADLHPAFPTFTEAVSVAAQKIVRQLGIAPMAPGWGDSRPAPARAAVG